MQNSNLKEIPCNICGLSEYKVLGVKNSYQIVACSCGLVYVNPQPTEEIINKIYDEKYFSGGYNFGRTSLNYIEDEEQFKWLPKIVLGLLEKVTHKKGKLLDFGCAAGYLLEMAKEKGWQINGIEISDYAKKIAEKKLKIEIHNTFEDSGLRTNSFDVITTLEVIEHLSNPTLLLKNLHTYLKRDGILILTTPNLKNAEIYKTFMDWECILPPVHLFFFSKQTVTKILKNNGFEVIYITYGPMNIFKGMDNKHIGNLKKIYYKVKPIIEPVKRILVDIPISWYGKKSGLGESMIVIAKKI